MVLGDYSFDLIYSVMEVTVIHMDGKIHPFRSFCGSAISFAIRPSCILPVIESLYPHISINGVEYAYYAALDNESSIEISEIDGVFACFRNDKGAYSYFAEFKDLDRTEWIVEFNDDGTGLPSQSTLKALYKGKAVEDIPEQLSQITPIQ